MKILVLNGSPRPNGNTAKMVKSFKDSAVSAGHEVTEIFLDTWDWMIWVSSQIMTEELWKRYPKWHGDLTYETSNTFHDIPCTSSVVNSLCSGKRRRIGCSAKQ